MINADEARNKTNELLKMGETKRMENLRTWVEETCDKEIKKAVVACEFETVVEVPNKHNIIDVVSELRNKGYTVKVYKYKTWGGSINKIKISWKKVKNKD